MLFCVLFFAVLVSVLVVVVSDLCFMDELHAKKQAQQVDGGGRGRKNN